MKPPQAPPNATELSQADLLNAAVVNIVKAVLREVLPKVFTGPSMQSLVRTVGQLDRTTRQLGDSLVDLQGMLETLSAVRRTKVRSQQLKARLSEKFTISMQAEGLPDALIRKIVINALRDDAQNLTEEQRLMCRDAARKAAERAKAAADKITDEPERKRKDKR